MVEAWKDHHHLWSAVSWRQAEYDLTARKWIFGLLNQRCSTGIQTDYFTCDF
jgi:hypothetical protein